MGGWMDKWMDGWMDGWIGKWIDGKVNLEPSAFNISSSLYFLYLD
jgi:hypothetical protein